MGADLIGYTICVPIKEAAGIVESAIRRYDAILKAVLDKDEKFCPDDLAPDLVDRVCKELLAAGANEHGYEELEPDEMIIALMEDLKIINGFVINDNGWCGGRDAISHTEKVNGQGIAFLFAGEMSWGDEPDGGGYTELRALNRLGIDDLFHKAIRWDARRKK